MQNESDSIMAKPHYVVRLLRSQPHIYSAVCKTRLFYSRYLAAARSRALYRSERSLFSMTDSQRSHSAELRHNGFTVLHDFFSPGLMDAIYARADRLFKDLQIDLYEAYSVHNRRRSSLQGMTYPELASSEKMISLKDPLLNIPECVPIAFNETLLKTVVAFLHFIPPLYRVTLVRDFPHDQPKESSNFHRDNDETDSIQIFVYLVDIDDTRGPLVYVPGTNRYDVKSCRPRLSRDLGINANDGRISDQEIEKYYARDSWTPVHARRGSVAIIHGNGFHKGPSWKTYGSPNNKVRTALRFDIHGYKAGVSMKGRGNKIRREDFVSLNRLQKLFTREYEVING
jgi:ectoine hydroxylase-related dioxygenase (phytanoyl-CoA dioxygenase family)